jgi:hypothetical protein
MCLGSINSVALAALAATTTAAAAAAAAFIHFLLGGTLQGSNSWRKVLSVFFEFQKKIRKVMNMRSPWRAVSTLDSREGKSFS